MTPPPGPQEEDQVQPSCAALEAQEEAWLEAWAVAQRPSVSAWASLQVHSEVAHLLPLPGPVFDASELVLAVGLLDVACHSAIDGAHPEQAG